MKYLLVIICILLLTSCGDTSAYKNADGIGITNQSSASLLSKLGEIEYGICDQSSNAVLEKDNYTSDHGESFQCNDDYVSQTTTDNNLNKEIKKLSDFLYHNPVENKHFSIVDDANIGTHLHTTIVADIMPMMQDDPLLSLFFYVFDDSGDLLVKMEYYVEGLCFLRVSSMVVCDIDNDGLNDLVFSAYGVAGNSVYSVMI